MIKNQVNVWDVPEFRVVIRDYFFEHTENDVFDEFIYVSSVVRRSCTLYRLRMPRMAGNFGL